MSRDSSLLNEVAASLAIIAACTIPAVTGLAKQLRTRAPKDHFYADQDGKSTPEAVAAFSNRWPKAFIALFAVLGCATSIAFSILSTASLEGSQGVPLEDWLGTASWLLLALQVVCIIATNDSVQAYQVGLLTGFSSLILLLVLLIQNTYVLGDLLRQDTTSFALRIVNLAAILGLTAASVSLPRRPDVFVNDKIVDRMHTVSAYSRFTWSWCGDVLKAATAKKDLEVVDLPRPDFNTRAEDMSAQWKAYNFKGPLWRNVIWAFRWSLTIQWALAIFRNFVSFAPYWVTLRILRALEARQPGEKLSVDTWIMVFWLGFTILADAWFTACMFWLSWSDVCVPLRGLLSALIVEKAMRRKNVKQATKTDTSHVDPTSSGQDGAKKDDKAEDEDEDADQLKSQQGVVNLIGVDAKRVSDFAAFQFFFPASATKLAVAIWFLVSLLGWIPLLAGLATWGVILPFNIYCTKIYANAQDRLMKIRDQKLALVNESLQGMRQIKFSALERQWEGRILAMRERELGAIWDVFKSDSFLFGSWVAIPILLAAASLAVYAWIHETLTPSVAFVSIGVFKSLELALSIIPELTTDLIDAKISINRIEAYLNGPEITQTVTEGYDVAFEDAEVAWPVDEATEDADRFILRDVNLSFPAGELSVISGKTGSGKSLLLAAILGETDLLSGKIYAPRSPSRIERNDSQANRGNWILPSSIAYVGQIPWIENASLKDNVLFGLPFDEQRFKDTIYACALTKDLDMFSDGDRTELGSNGINLSGGQKWRVTLARAIYSRAGILVLDDIFSAVDAHVGRHIFEKCLTGALSRGRTRILVTHHVALCESRTKYIVELGDGTVQHHGLLSELDEDGTLQLIKSHEQHQPENGGGDDEATAVNSEQASDVNVDAIQTTLETEDGDGGVLKKVPSTAARQFVEDETREQGAIKQHVYVTYLRDSGGWPWWTIATTVFVAFEAITLGRSWWLRIWTGDTAEANVHGLQEYDHIYATSLQHSTIHAASTPLQTTQARSLEYYLGVYIAISLATVVLGIARFFYLFLMSLKASRRMFQNMTHTILRTPLRWLDTVPVGRILNRFTADFNIIDSRIAIDLTLTFNSALSVIGICIASMFVSPYIIVLATILLLICTHIAVRYLNAARPSKRLESTTKSPIFELFGSALTGVTTIRGFDKAHTYINAVYTKLDDYDMATWHLWLFNRWMGWRMSIVGAMFSVVVAIMILADSQMDAALAGFTLSFALDFSESVLWAIRNYASIELDMNAAERVVEYSELPTENQGGEEPPAMWPTEGRLEVNDLVVSYADDLPPVLKGLTFSVNKNERIGVIGRTGAGKSSLTLALFRFLEARSGSIHVDGLDISKIKLQELRSRLAIIPQDPVLFSGTVRSNLDPFSDRTDVELEDSLQRVHLVGSDESIPGTPGEPSTSASSPTTAVAKNTNPFRSLSSAISEGGLNLSQGQRQLLCLARAIVSRPKIMVLDEATSAVDMATDALIQRSIREEFTGSTLIVIAHRLSTIADFDRILVLGEGKVVEFGSPRELWEKGDEGVFRGMCEESGEKEKLKGVIFGLSRWTDSPSSSGSDTGTTGLSLEISAWSRSDDQHIFQGNVYLDAEDFTHQESDDVRRELALRPRGSPEQEALDDSHGWQRGRLYQSRMALLPPPSLKTLIMFEDFNEDFDLAFGGSRVPCPKAAVALAERSIWLEEFSAAYLVDAQDFFAATIPPRRTFAKWHKLRSLALTSRLLDNRSHADKVFAMLMNASSAALRMPALRLMEIWFAKRHTACVFRYRVSGGRASIFWRGTWLLSMRPKLVQAWQKVARFHTELDMVVEETQMIFKVFRSHASAIFQLGLHAQVAHPASLEEIWRESDRYSYKVGIENV
ncbi:hypothetical protein ACHAQA_000425 [Verticillium albo-atrum]